MLKLSDPDRGLLGQTYVLRFRLKFGNQILTEHLIMPISHRAFCGLSTPRIAMNLSKTNLQFFRSPGGIYVFAVGGEQDPVFTACKNSLTFSQRCEQSIPVLKKGGRSFFDL